MAIERDPSIEFHEQGTLNSVTRWISSHDEGLAEWLKNARRAYQDDRAAVPEAEWCALLLLRDSGDHGPARIGLLDVGGATEEDVAAWSVWQDPRASSRASDAEEEETQGNGGKAYMYRLFTGPAKIVGIRDGMRNVKGFEGPPQSVDRGTPGFMPDEASGHEVPITSLDAELRAVLEPFGLTPSEIPVDVYEAINSRRAFTLVEGADPIDVWRGQIDAEGLIRKTVRHEQSTLALQQLRVYAIHDGVSVEGGAPLALPAIPPYPDLEGPFVHEIPEELELPDGRIVSTTEDGTKAQGRLILMTSHDHMPNAYKKLRPRWKMSYKSKHQMIGSKPIPDLLPVTTGAAYIYGTVELPALEPRYVDHGRRRPKDGPVIEAVDHFAAEKIKALAQEISERRHENLDEQTLDEVHEENRKLDEFKNQFLSVDGDEGDGGNGEDGEGPGRPLPPPVDYGTEPESIELVVPEPALRVGVGVELPLKRTLAARVVDAVGRTVPGCELVWRSADDGIVAIEEPGLLKPRRPGSTEVRAVLPGGQLESVPVVVEVWSVDHVRLTPREMKVPLGSHQPVTAEVTSNEGERATDVYLDWRHDADDQMIVRIRPSGLIIGNRPGRTLVAAGVGDPDRDGVWSRIPVDVSVVPSAEQPGRGSGFPRLLLTGRDLDPATDSVREGDPDGPVLWQEPSDFAHNVWWLNLQSPEAAFVFDRRRDDPVLWRQFHVRNLIEMVAQVQMGEEYTSSGDERQGYWNEHKQALERHQVQTVQQMWSALQPYVEDGGLLV